MKVHPHLGPYPANAGRIRSMPISFIFHHFPDFTLTLTKWCCSIFNMTLLSHFTALFCHTVKHVHFVVYRVFIQLLLSNPGWKEGKILAPADKLSPRVKSVVRNPQTLPASWCSTFWRKFSHRLYCHWTDLGIISPHTVTSVLYVLLNSCVYIIFSQNC